jgi:hypothetical protein
VEVPAVPSEGVVRHDVLPAGTLLVRHGRPDDVEALLALYDGLGFEDRYRRFFSGFRPDERFVEQSLRKADRGGCLLVAELRSTDGQTRCVGTADYELLPDGDGELAITVASDWRGWLGPYLLDALVETAAAHGIPNLEAEVLLTNRPMLAMLRARLCVFVDHADWSIARVLIGAAQRVPTWPGAHDRRRVLVEGRGARWRPDDGAGGLEVIRCHGPGPRCPVLDDEPCPLAAGADLIVVGQHDDDGRRQQLICGHERLHPGVPLRAEADEA